MESAISFKNVTKDYGSFRLDHVNLEVPKGCIVGLVGENGAGKTTLLRSLLQMVQLDEGSVEVYGESKEWKDYQWKDEIGVVLPGLGSFAQMNAAQLEACMKQFYSRWDEEQFAAYLDRFHIDKRKRIGKYSTGMSRKLDLAVALSHHARLLILDEATSGLDPMVRDEILEILTEFIQDEEHTVLMSTHIVSDLERSADYIAFLHQGRLQFFAEKDVLLESYGMYRCSREEYEGLDPAYIAGVRKNSFDCEVLIRHKEEALRRHPQMRTERASLEEILVYQIRGKEA